jgi:lactoylglutathione lyase
MTPEATAHINGFRTVGVHVADQDRALAFYTGTLGLEVRMDASFGSGQRWIEVAPAGAATTIALVAAHEGQPAGTETGIRLTSPDADAVHEYLRGQSLDVDEVLRWPGVPAMFALRDPDGNGLEIVEQP